MGYISVEDARRNAGIDDTLDDVVLQAAIDAATEAIDDHCGRYFTQDADVSARIYDTRSYPGIVSPWVAYVHDISTTTGLIVKIDDGDDGTYETTFATTDYQLEPLNGIVAGRTGWPFTRIRAVDSFTFPTSSHIAPLQVTARWGWAAVPDAVEQACRVLTQWIFKTTRDAPMGVAGYGDFGQIRVREHPVAAMLLAPLVRQPAGA